MTATPVALVTGASRGIGKATALKLAEAGFDVAITARTEREGEGRTEPNSVRDDDPIVAIPGSLERTAAEIEARGQRALPISSTCSTSTTSSPAPRRVLAEWGRIDVLFNNAIFQARASMDRIIDLTADSMTRLVTGNYVHQLLLIQQVIPHMVERGSGRISTWSPAPPGSTRPRPRERVGGASPTRRRRPPSPGSPAGIEAEFSDRR